MNEGHIYTFPNGIKIDFSNLINDFNEDFKGVAYGTLGHSYSKTIYPDGTITEWKDGKRIG